MGTPAATARATVRVLTFLARGPASAQRSALQDAVLLDGGPRGTIAVARSELDAMASAGLVRRARAQLALSDAGAAWLRRHPGGVEAFRNQHRDLAEIRLQMPDGDFAPATANLAESPLAKLARHKTRNGAAFLSADEFQAGERLRADYTRGQIMPRMGAHWEASVATGRRGGNGVAEITDATLAARQRVDRAIGTVGPELAGVLVDVCCFLKGLEQIEMERGWPVRSAKVVLKTALATLARHYAPPARARAAAGGSGLLHWGSPDYRPKIQRE